MRDSESYDETKKVKRAFVCGVAWQHELGETDIKLHPSLESLWREHKCTDKCGVVEVEVRLVRWVKPQSLDLK
jgi:hypothetical protein